MSARRDIRHAPHRGAPPSAQELERRFTEEGLDPHWWANHPADTYSWHEHDYHKVFYCAEGSIVFHTHAGDYELHAGDRLDIPPATPHAATVGSEGVRCIEAPRAG